MFFYVLFFSQGLEHFFLQVRERRSIRSGSLLEDVIVAMIFSPNVAMQMEVTILKKP